MSYSLFNCVDLAVRCSLKLLFSPVSVIENIKPILPLKRIIKTQKDLLVSSALKMVMIDVTV